METVYHKPDRGINESVISKRKGQMAHAGPAACMRIKQFDRGRERVGVINIDRVMMVNP